MALRRRVGPVRRGEFFPFVPATAPAVATRAPGWIQRRRAVPGRAARGEFFPVVPTAAPVAPARVPDWLQHRRPASKRPSRGEFFSPTPLSQAPAPAISRRRPARSLARRGELWPMPLVGAVASFGPWLPPLLSRRRVPAQARRGEFFVVPLAGLAPSAPPPVVPPLLTHRPVRVLPRRGEFLPVAPTPVFCAVPVPRRRRPATAGRRGRGWTAPVSLPPPGPGPWLPRTLRAAARVSPRRASRGRYWATVLESTACDPVTHRPNSGLTARQGSGIAPRPVSGVTARPTSCG